MKSLVGAKHKERQTRPAVGLHSPQAVEESNMGATFLQKDVTS